MTATLRDVQSFWDAHPCGSWLSETLDRRQYFAEITERRYAMLPFLPHTAQFDRFAGRRVLEIGCGIGTDGLQFATHGATYTGLDLTPAGVSQAREQFELSNAPGAFAVADAERLPFAEGAFDHLYSWGVIHHSPDTEATVREMFRVLRPGGTVCVMIYNKSSINYLVEIMVLRRLMRWLLYPSFAPALIARMTGLPRWKLAGHRDILLRGRSGRGGDWLSANTDGPDCPLAKVYDREDALRLFGQFDGVRMDVRYFDHTHWPVIGRRLPRAAREWLGNHAGWLRIVHARRPLDSG